jgi:hypothetical protein
LNGVCQPATILANGGGNSRGIAANAGTIWAAYGANGASDHIGTCSGACTGGLSPIITSNNIQTVVINPAVNLLYYTDSTAGVFAAYSVTTGSISYSLGSMANAQGIAFDNTYVYWGANGNVGRTPRATSTGSNSGWATGMSLPYALAWDPGTANLFIVDYALGNINVCSTAGGALCGNTWTSIATGVPNPTGVAVTPGHVFFTSLGTTSNNYQDGGVWMCPTSGPCAPIKTIGPQFAFAYAVTSDASNIYFSAGGNIWRCGLGGCGGVVGPPDGGPPPPPDGGAGGMPTVVASGVGNARYLTTDATAIYWTNDGGSIFRLAK